MGAFCTETYAAVIDEFDTTSAVGRIRQHEIRCFKSVTKAPKYAIKTQSPVALARQVWQFLGYSGFLSAK